MKNNIIICGLIAGLIVTALMLAAMAKIYDFSYFEGSMMSMVLGYTSMLVAFSLIFVAVKNYRDKQGEGVITFGKAFRIGLVVTLIASTMYVGVWLIYYYFFMPDFYDKYAAHQLLQMKAGGASAAELSKAAANMQIYKNPVVIILMTYFEILPVGLLISLLAAVILKRRSNPGNVELAAS